MSSLFSDYIPTGPGKQPAKVRGGGRDDDEEWGNDDGEAGGRVGAHLHVAQIDGAGATLVHGRIEGDGSELAVVRGAADEEGRGDEEARAEAHGNSGGVRAERPGISR